MRKGIVAILVFIFVLGIACTVFAASETELNQEVAALKVRMAELETKMKAVKPAKSESDKLSFDGADFRIRWVNDGKNNGDSVFQERIRLNMNYKVNDNIKLNIRWRVMNENELGTTGTDDKNKLSDANVSIKNVMGATMTMGRFSQGFGATSYWNSTTIGLIDGVKVSFGKDIKVTTGFANFGAYKEPKQTITVTENASGKHTVTVTETHSPTLEDTYFLNASYAASRATTLYGMWVKEKDGSDGDYDVKGLGLRTKLSDDFQLWGDFTKNYAKANNPSGYYLSLRWRDADEDNPGSFGMRLDYRNIKNGNMFSTSGQGVNIPTQTFKGPAVSAHYAIAKNVILEGFQTFATKDADTGVSKPNYSRLQVIVGF